MKAIYLLFAIFYLLFPIPAAYSATPTPKQGEVGVKAEVKGSAPSFYESAASNPSTVSASPSVKKQAEEPAKKETPKDTSKEQIQEPSGFLKKELEELEKILAKDDLWLKLLVLVWIVFIAIIVFLILKHRKKKKLEAQNIGSLSQTPGGTAPTGSGTTVSETDVSS